MLPVPLDRAVFLFQGDLLIYVHHLTAGGELGLISHCNFRTVQILSLGLWSVLLV